MHLDFYLNQPNPLNPAKTNSWNSKYIHVWVAWRLLQAVLPEDALDL